MDELQSLKQRLASYLDSSQGKYQLWLSQAVEGKAHSLASYLGELRARVDQSSSIEDVRLAVGCVGLEMRSVQEKLGEAEAFYTELYKICEPFGVWQ